jgi:hypothetical protein
MPRSEMPEKYKQGLNIIADLSESELSSLLSILSETNISLNTRTLLSSIVSRLSEKLAEKSATELSILVDTIIFFCYTIPSDRELMSLQEVVDQIVSDLKELSITHDHQYEILKDRLKVILGTKLLSNLNKATSLVQESQNIFSDVRIISDIRPIFGEDVHNQPVGAFVIHNLRISYVSNERRQEIYFALDSQDIEIMIKELTRAKDKTEQLAQFVKQTDTSYVSTE